MIINNANLRMIKDLQTTDKVIICLKIVIIIRKPN